MFLNLENMQFHRIITKSVCKKLDKLKQIIMRQNLRPNTTKSENQLVNFDLITLILRLFVLVGAQKRLGCCTYKPYSDRENRQSGLYIMLLFARSD